VDVLGTAAVHESVDLVQVHAVVVGEGGLLTQRCDTPVRRVVKLPKLQTPLVFLIVTAVHALVAAVETAKLRSPECV